MDLKLCFLLCFCYVYLGQSNASPEFLTQTVYGFLDFTTTMGNTVMVFSPQSAPPLDLLGNVGVESVNAIQTSPINTKHEAHLIENDIQPTKIKSPTKTLKSETNAKKALNKIKLSTTVEAVTPAAVQYIVSQPHEEEQQLVEPQQQESDDAVAIKIDNELDQPEYDLLSREPTEYAEETYRLINLKTSGNGAAGRQRQANTHAGTNTTTRKTTTTTKNIPKQTINTHNNQSKTNKTINHTNHNNNDNNQKQLSVGLVTKLSGTTTTNEVDGLTLTTVYETSVIGTYISGKYAQVLQSSSQVFQNRKSKPKIRPSASAGSNSVLRVLKTAAPVLPVSTPKTVTPSAPRSGSFKSRKNSNSARSFKNEQAQAQVIQVNAETTVKTTTETGSGFKKSRSGGKSKRRKNHSSRTTTTTANSVKESPPSRKFQNKIQHSPVEQNPSSSSTSIYMFKLNRTPGRWQYKTSPKPRVSIRKTAAETSANNNPLLNGTQSGNAVSSIADALTHENSEQNTILEQGDLESSGSESAGNNVNNINDPDIKQKLFVETLNVDISTPADFNDTYYEIATIKTPFTYQAGNVKKTRFITVTSTIEKVLKSEPVSASAFNDKPLIENILDTPESKSVDNLLLDGSITTLSPLYITDDIETPSLETVTESFSIVQTKLRTQILPIVFEQRNETSYSTLIHTYDFTSLIVATKTLSPFDVNQFQPTKHFKDFGGNLDEAGSEINLELEFGDDNPDDLKNDGQIAAVKKDKQQDKDLLLNNSQQTSDQLQQQLALLKLLQPSLPLHSVITNTHPVVKLETLWESHVVPIVNAGTTNYRTLSKSIGVVDKTEYRIDTTTIPLIPPSPQPPQLTQNPYLLPVPDVLQTITNSFVQDTITTAVNSKILKLTFGARTAYTTIFSTQVMPTKVTMYLTSTIPVQATAPPAFPGYFPPPYPPYAYVG